MNPSKLEILAYEDTDLGPLCLRRRELLAEPGIFVTEVTLNHEFLMSSYNTDSERALSNRAVEIHGGSSLRTLVGGLGLGYTARELVENPNVDSVEVIEFIPHVIQWLRDGLIPLSDLLGTADNLTLSQGDVYEQLLSPASESFDVIVIDVDHSPSDQLGEEQHAFYSEQGLRAASQHLNENGVLAVWSYAESSEFSDALRRVFNEVSVEPVETTNTLVGHDQTDWLFFAR